MKAERWIDDVKREEMFYLLLVPIWVFLSIQRKVILSLTQLRYAIFPTQE